LVDRSLLHEPGNPNKMRKKLLQGRAKSDVETISFRNRESGRPKRRRKKIEQQAAGGNKV